MELSKEMVEEYFENECDFYMNLYPSEDIVIKRFHLRDAEWDEDNDRKLFYFKQEERLKEILKHVDGNMDVEELKKLISKVEYEQWDGLE